VDRAGHSKCGPDTAATSIATPPSLHESAGLSPDAFRTIHAREQFLQTTTEEPEMAALSSATTIDIEDVSQATAELPLTNVDATFELASDKCVAAPPKTSSGSRALSCIAEECADNTLTSNPYASAEVRLHVSANSKVPPLPMRSSQGIASGSQPRATASLLSHRSSSAGWLSTGTPVVAVSAGSSSNSALPLSSRDFAVGFQRSGSAKDATSDDLPPTVPVSALGTGGATATVSGSSTRRAKGAADDDDAGSAISSGTSGANTDSVAGISSRVKSAAYFSLAAFGGGAAAQSTSEHIASLRASAQSAVSAAEVARDNCERAWALHARARAAFHTQASNAFF
jgi:hypothetical protein